VKKWRKESCGLDKLNFSAFLSACPILRFGTQNTDGTHKQWLQVAMPKPTNSAP
jgi:hypothetical protein